MDGKEARPSKKPGAGGSAPPETAQAAAHPPCSVRVSGSPVRSRAYSRRLEADRADMGTGRRRDGGDAAGGEADPAQ